MQRSVTYILSFAAAVCIVCGVLVSSSAVSLKELQEINAELERKTNVLLAAGLATGDEKLDADEVDRRFSVVVAQVIDLETGAADDSADPLTFDQQRAKLDPKQSRAAPANDAGIKRVPHQALVYTVVGDDGQTELYVLPIEGYGLWSTLYGFIAIESDLTTIRGLTFYQHGETPGLGGEVDNPDWKSLWRGRRAFNEEGETAIQVVKGRAGRASEDPYSVDGLSGASITSRGVTKMLRFWLGENGFGPFLDRARESQPTPESRQARSAA